MLLGYFTEDAYDRLLHDIPQNSENYSSPDDWLPSYFGSTSDFYKMSSVDVSMFVTEPGISPKQLNNVDYERPFCVYGFPYIGRKVPTITCQRLEKSKKRGEFEQQEKKL